MLLLHVVLFTGFLEEVPQRLMKAMPPDGEVSGTLMGWLENLSEVEDGEEGNLEYLWYKYVDEVLSVVVGCENYKSCRRKTKKPSEIFTESDETFVLVTIKNGYNRWLDEWNKLQEVQVGGEGFKSSVPNLYTGEEGTKGKGKTWEKSKGPKEYLRLYSNVKEDRTKKRRKDMEERFVKWVTEEYAEEEKKAKKKREEKEERQTEDMEDLNKLIASGRFATAAVAV